MSNRNYAAISPSAKSLVLLKGITNIPFAKRTAELISASDAYTIDENNNDAAFWKRVVHFEIRYQSIDQLLSSFATSNILELSSGYSFRGLDIVGHKKVHYIDTDLPDVITRKKELILDLQEDMVPGVGALEMVALNALDEKEFNEIVDSFPEGPITIVNEGLMMYLNNSEKEKLCRIIHNILSKRGGEWITADIYVKSTLERFKDEEDDSLKDLVENQKIEDNMFDSFEAAELFFKEAGFVVVQEASVDLSKVSSLHFLIKNATEAELMEMKTSTKKIQTTWCLKVKGSS